VLRDDYESKLQGATNQAKSEINALTAQAHEKLASTRSDLEVKLRSVEKDYLSQFRATLKRLETIVGEHGTDKWNEGRQPAIEVAKIAGADADMFAALGK